MITVACALMVLGTLQKEVLVRTSSSGAEENSEVRVDGFRSARFGMTEKGVLKSIFKDFKIPKSKIQRRVHPTEKTLSFKFQMNDLLPDSGKASLFYVFGFNSKRLIQVNVLWGRTTEEKPDPQRVVDTANQLRTHFLNQGFQKKGLAVNSKLPDGSVPAFRGVDAKGRRVILLLVNPPRQGGSACQSKY